MLTLAGCSAPNKQKNPQELRKEAYEILEGKNGSRTTLQELKEAGHKFVDSLSEDIAQKLSKGNSRPSTIRLSPQQCKERLKRYGDAMIDIFSYMTLEELKQVKEVTEQSRSNEEEQLKDSKLSSKQQTMIREAIEYSKFVLKCIENFIK